MRVIKIPAVKRKDYTIKSIVEDLQKLCNEYKEKDFIPTKCLNKLFYKIKITSNKMHKKHANFSLTVNKEMLYLIDFLVDAKFLTSRSELVRNALLDYLPKQIEIQCYFELFKQIKIDLTRKCSKSELINDTLVINGIKKLIIKQEDYKNDKSNNKKD